MAAYAVAQITWEDPHGPQRYLENVQKSLRRFGVRYLAFGPVTVIEGDRAPRYLTIAEFPSLDEAKRAYKSEEYSLARKIRAISAKTEWLVFIDGLKI